MPSKTTRSNPGRKKNTDSQEMDLFELNLLIDEIESENIEQEPQSAKDTGSEHSTKKSHAAKATGKAEDGSASGSGHSSSHSSGHSSSHSSGHSSSHSSSHHTSTHKSGHHSHKRKKSVWRNFIESLPGLFAAIIFGVLAGCLIFIIGFRVYPAMNVVESITIEAGTETLSVDDFLRRKSSRASLVTDISSLDLNTVTSYPIEIQIGKKTYESTLVIEDTTAPTGTTEDQEGALGSELDASAFVTEISDATTVTVSYITDPDFDQEGTQTVALLLTDEGGNTAELSAQLTLIEDTEAPVIEGVESQSIYVGETISYKSGVTVTDNYDTDVTLEVDTSEVDLNTAGSYTVTYYATDSSGNTSSVTAMIIVEEAPDSDEEELLEELTVTAQEILDEILTDDMDEEDQLYAIFCYCQANITYTGSSDKSSWINEAYNALTTHVGDCFTYFSLAKLLMETAGFSTIDVERINGETHHYWSLVYVNDGWYHIDTCPRSASHYSEWLCFLRTDAELEEFSTTMVEGYYTFDTSLYPATPES